MASEYVDYCVYAVNGHDHIISLEELKNRFSRRKEFGHLQSTSIYHLNLASQKG
jgi:hypothetical protein